MTTQLLVRYGFVEKESWMADGVSAKHLQLLEEKASCLIFISVDGKKEYICVHFFFHSRTKSQLFVFFFFFS